AHFISLTELGWVNTTGLIFGVIWGIACFGVAYLIGHCHYNMPDTAKRIGTIRMNLKRVFFKSEINNGISLALIAAISLAASSAHALELDWSGKFRTEFHFIKNYTMDSSAAGSTVDSSRIVTNTVNGTTYKYPSGYYIPGGGNNNATFETL